jgi:HK97 family phage prohead protease
MSEGGAVPELDIQYRTASTVGVDYADRIIELIAVPYNETTDVMRRGRLVAESVDPQAFIGAKGQVTTEIITVNRAHDLERPIGKVRDLHPNDLRGLRSELKISKGTGGDEALELANDGLLFASVGFESIGEQWSTDRSTVKVTKARLVHIALTGNPAYPGAKVLAVRSGDETPTQRVLTPNLDRILLELKLARG